MIKGAGRVSTNAGRSNSLHVARVTVRPTYNRHLKQHTVPRAVADQVQDLLVRFKQADIDGNGKIDRAELQSLLEGDGQRWIPDDHVSQIMAMYDADSSGTIELEEFKNMVEDGLILDGKVSELEAAFKAVDGSGNGTLGASELARLMEKLGKPVTMERLVEIMQEFDTDESGQIEFGEFLMMFRNQLLDLDQVMSYVTTQPADENGKVSVIQPVEGGLNLIFSESEFDELLQQSYSKLVMVFVAFTWCRPCKAVSKSVAKLAEYYKDHLLVLKMYGNANKQMINLGKNRLCIQATPSYAFIKNGEIVTLTSGAKKEKVEAAIRANLPEDQLPANLFPPLA